ncbi:MAG: DegT/DnrJ/EryC1/StrS aminotransferase family protein [Candidatus Omnitrophica bacterium]|nr:DegT/DnrJ/EryC1/StrS aminotransferase family protein [Candidatus Omnitrophota bacterium]
MNMKDIIPHSRPTLGKEEASAAAKVVMSGHVSQGPRVREFEKALSKFIGVRDAVAVSSGTAALHLGLLAMGIGKKDEVILPSYVCTAPLNAVCQTGARPVLADIEMESFNISSGGVNDVKTRDSKAVIVPHMFGAPADMESIAGTGVPIIEDLAHSIGAFYGRKRAGSFGRCAIASFYANKMMAAGEGGAVLSNDKRFLDSVRDLREYDNKEDYEQRYNYKMSDILAAVGMVQLKKLPTMIKKRKKLAKVYDKALAASGYVLPKGEFDHVYYRYVVRFSEGIEKLLRQAKERGVLLARPVYKPLHRYLEMRTGFRNSDNAYSTAISLPIYPTLSRQEQNRVIKVLMSYSS